jgi:hypothetical protein
LLDLDLPLGTTPEPLTAPSAALASLDLDGLLANELRRLLTIKISAVAAVDMSFTALLLRLRAAIILLVVVVAVIVPVLGKRG